MRDAPPDQSRLIRILRIAVAWIFSAVYWGLFLPIHILTFRRLPEGGTRRGLRFWGQSVLWILGIRLKILNDNPLLERKTQVLILNHQSGLDLIWGAAIAPPAPLVIGKKEIIYVPIINLLWWALDFRRVDREDLAKALTSLEEIQAEMVRNKRTFIVAPEGRCSRDGRILPFKMGAFYAALKARAPIYPVVVSGANRLLGYGELVPRSGTIQVKFLPPIETDDWKVKELVRRMETIRETMVRELEAMEESAG